MDVMSEQDFAELRSGLALAGLTYLEPALDRLRTRMEVLKGVIEELRERMAAARLAVIDEDSVDALAVLVEDVHAGRLSRRVQ